MKLSGAQSRPIMKDKEKLRVARVERKRPKRRREKDLIRRYCWGVIGGVDVVRPWVSSRAARIMGRMRSTITKV